MGEKDSDEGMIVMDWPFVGVALYDVWHCGSMLLCMIDD